MDEIQPKPEILSLVVCDQIITDRVTGKQSLIGIFSVVHATNFPVNHPQLSVYTSLTSGHGSVELMIRIVDSKEARPPLVQGQGKSKMCIQRVRIFTVGFDANVGRASFDPVGACHVGSRRVRPERCLRPFITHKT